MQCTHLLLNLILLNSVAVMIGEKWKLWSSSLRNCPWSPMTACLFNSKYPLTYSVLKHPQPVILTNSELITVIQLMISNQSGYTNVLLDSRHRHWYGCSIDTAPAGFKIELPLV